MNNRKISCLGFNVVLHHADKKSVDVYIKSLIELKAEWVRLCFDYLYPSDMSLFQYFVKLCKKNNIKVAGLLINNVKGHALHVIFPYLFYRPIFEEKENFYAFVKKIAKLFEKDISYWHILNEVNTVRFWIKPPNPKEYVEMLKQTNKILLNVNKHNRIIFGSIVGNDSNVLIPFQISKFLKYSMLLGAGKHFDVASFHPYFFACYCSLRDKTHYVDEFAANLRKIILLTQGYDKPVWITEFGISSRWVRLTQKEIAWIYVQILMQCKKENVPLFFWQLADAKKHNYIRGNPEKYFGFLTADLKKKTLFNEFVKLCETV